MKKITRLLPVLLGLSAINLAVVGLSSIQKAEAQITTSNWVGTWKCNNDGQLPLTQVTFWSYGSSIYGQIGNDYYALQPRSYDPSIDPPSARQDQLLTLYRPANNTQWILARHTWNNDTHASGFTRWNGSVFGLYCTRQ